MDFHDVFGKCVGTPRKQFDLLRREQRVIAIGEWAAAVLSDSPRDGQVEYWLAQCFLAWLRNAENSKLTRDHFRTAAGQGCTQSEASIWQRLKEPSSRRERVEKNSPTMEPSKPNQEETQ